MSRSRFVPKQHVAIVRAQLRNYAKLRKLTERWIEVAEELRILGLQERKRD